ncbi:591a93b9-4664-4f3d-aca6-c15d9907c54d [Sclerotinia trifoliorum]|uniref:591a93b9-4664-4f3d-aca6-c15d9907c54d n=1 Tax=Sclerotinia trifoliorum TaxID=28548 RepID=A0A8H2ZLY7_9HELO|nr:591a93b9-4664-4f3d-aca6-c15d9907c54d [Sclerotinia trifoliorum]
MLQYGWALVLIANPVVSSSQIPLRVSQDYSANSHSQDYKFDPLLHLPGISPYFDAVGVGLNHRAPRLCEVTAASYLVRHAAIYANDDDYETYIEPFLKKLDSTYTKTSGKKRKGWTGPLAFFEKWQSPIDDPENQMEQITPQGIKDSKKVAKHLLSRYPELVPTTKRIYADKKSRTQDTAKAFSKVFPQEVEIVEIGTNRSSFHSQVPHKACDAFTKKPGNEEQQTFLAKYAPPVIARLQQYSPVELRTYDIMGLQQMCGYESAITGKVSKICDVFTDDEWMAYEYAWDMKYSRMVGHGNPLSIYLGFPWLNTTAQLFSKFHAPQHSNSSDDEIPDDDGQRFFLSFTHREVPPFIATALGLFNSSNAFAEEFPTDRINWSRSWRMSELIPFLGHVGIEKLTCKGLKGDASNEGDVEEFVRIIANTAPRPIPECQGGPGASCKFDQFVEIINRGLERYGDFDGVCKNKKEVPKNGY